MRLKTEPFEDVMSAIIYQLANAPVVDVGEWQAIQGDIPQAKTIEVEDVSFAIPLPPMMITWQQMIQPNLPWAEDHFQERVGGVPVNPPPSSEYWPHATAGNAAFKSDEKFSHTYPERMWPIWANETERPHYGIRYQYGSLGDVINLLRERPGTRQAYLPIWFPEDTGAVENQRVPCTLGYHFMVRNNQLKIVYYIRSCDFYRHFLDDVYMAGRLGQYVAALVGATTDRLVMHISSLHIFEAEKGRIEKDVLRDRYAHSEAVEG